MIPASRGLLSALGLAGLAGATVALQARSNGELGAELEDPYVAALVSCTVGVATLLLVTWIAPQGRQRLRESLRLIRSHSVPIWALSGGLAGSFLVLAQSAAIRTLGVALFSVGSIAGQVIMGIVLDRVGLGTGRQLAIRPARLLGAALAVVAIVVTSVGIHHVGAASWLLVLPLLAGMGTGWQAAVNGRLRQATGSALTATLLNFSVGLIPLVFITGTALLISGWPAHWPTDVWPYVGGLLGVAYVGLSAFLVRSTGVLLLGLAIIAGQLISALILDTAVPLGPRPGPSTVLGVVLALMAVVIVAVPRRKAHGGREIQA